MARSPHLSTSGGELYLELAVRDSRRRFALSDRAKNLLYNQGYKSADIVPFVTAKVLVLTGGATLPEKSDERDTAWGLRGADGGRSPTSAERDALGAYICATPVPDRSLGALKEHIQQHNLPVDIDEITSRSDKVSGLSDIARNL
jgi:hypothetical protein